MKNLPTVSIGISALNEQANITKLLRSIIRQKEAGFQLLEILVFSDGSTDKTVQKIRAIADDRIVLFDEMERIGKSERLNQIFHRAQGDIITLFDADVVLASNKTLYNLIQPIIRDPRVGFVGGNPQAIRAKTFIESAVNSSFKAYDYLRSFYKNGNSVYGCDGRILALSKPFSRKVHVPHDMIANDAFMYFACITSGFEFRHVRDAIVWFRSPTTLADQIKQNKRFIAAHFRLAKIYGDVVWHEYHIPKHIILWLLFKQCVKSPIKSIFIFGLNRYIRHKAKQEEGYMTAMWPMAVSTKNGIANN